MWQVLDQWDKRIFLFLNGLHQDWLDYPMQLISGKLTWLPLYLVLIGLLIYRFRRKVIGYFITIALCITAADQFASGLMKPLVKRLRPCREPEIMDQVYALSGCGQYGFMSSHAANSFALAVFMGFALSKFSEGKMLTISLFVWATIVAYSRIYVGVHYPADVICGGLSGGLWAFLICRLAHRYRLFDLQIPKF
jgi:undecaprenyl-diphosphatase